MTPESYQTADLSGSSAGAQMTDQVDYRETKIRGYAQETALCVDVPLAALEEQILGELQIGETGSSKPLIRLLESVREHRKILERFTHRS